MNSITLTLEVIYPNFESIKIKAVTYSLSNDKRTLKVVTFYDRFTSFIEIPRHYVINVFLVKKHNVKVALFK